MKVRCPATTIFALLLLTSVHLTAGIAHAQESPFAKTARLLNETGVSYKKIDEGMWSVRYKGDNREEIDVIVAAYQEYVIIFTEVAASYEVSLTPDVMKRLLEVNDEVDWAKIGLNKEGDLFVRIDLSIRSIDKQELLDCLVQTATVTDLVAGIVKRSRPR